MLNRLGCAAIVMPPNRRIMNLSVSATTLDGPQQELVLAILRTIEFER